MDLIGVCEENIGRLRSLVHKYPEVVFLAVAGSVAGRGFSAHDVDVAVKLSGTCRKYDVLISLLGDISRILRVPEDRIDLIDLDRADPEVKLSVLRGSIIVIDGGYREELVREVEETYLEHSEYSRLSLNEWLWSEDPTSINMAVVKRRLDFVRAEIGFLMEHVLQKPLDEIRGSPVLSRVLERSYQLIIEALIDVARQIVSSMGWKPCFTATEYIERLAEHGAIPRELAGEIVKRIRLRNIIIHRYLDVDYGEMYSDASKLIAVAKEFEKHVVKFIRSHSMP